MDKNIQILAMQNIVNIAVGIPKYSFAMYQNAPRPSPEKFAAIRLIASRNPGYDDITTYTNNEGKLVQKTEGIRELIFDILFNRDDEDIIKFDNSFYRPDVQQACFDNGLELLRKKPTNLRNRGLETTWEIRTGISCIMSAIVIDEFIIEDTLEEINISSAFTDDAGNTTDSNLKLKEA